MKLVKERWCVNGKVVMGEAEMERMEMEGEHERGWSGAREYEVVKEGRRISERQGSEKEKDEVSSDKVIGRKSQIGDKEVKAGKERAKGGTRKWC